MKSWSWRFVPADFTVDSCLELDFIWFSGLCCYVRVLLLFCSSLSILLQSCCQFTKHRPNFMKQHFFSITFIYLIYYIFVTVHCAYTSAIDWSPYYNFKILSFLFFYILIINMPGGGDQEIIKRQKTVSTNQTISYLN